MKSFEDYRDRMLEIIATSETLLQAEQPDDTETLDLCRARMARILTAYHLYADRELFTPCMGLTDPAHRMRVREISAECATLSNEFRAFTRECTASPVLGRWADYRVAAHAMTARIRRHLKAAEVEVRLCETVEEPAQLAS